MDRKIIIASLSNIANELDNLGLYKEANGLTDIMSRVSEFFPSTPPYAFKDNSKPLKPKMTPNEVVYNVMKRMFGADYNNLPGLNSKMIQNRQEIHDAVVAEAQENGVKENDAIMRLNAGYDKTGRGYQLGRKVPIYTDRGVTGPSVFDPTQDTENYDPAKGDYDLNTVPMYDKAMQWINRNGGKGPSQAKKDAFDAKNAREISPQLYAVIEEILQPRIMKTPARIPPMGPFRKEK